MIKDTKTDWSVDGDIQKALLGHLTTELEVAKKNNEKVNEDFKTFYNMIHSIRNKKPHEWESDISLPEFVSRLLVQVGNFCAQYFSSTDYVENDLESDDPQDVAEAQAAKKLLNVLLKDPDNHYYHKIVRLINFVFTCGYGIIKGGYNQQIDQVLSHHEQKSDFITHDETGGYMAEDGTPYIDPTVQIPAMMSTQTPVYKDQTVKDMPTFEIWPNQNVYQSPEYTYSLNDKEYVIFETEKTLSQLKAEKEQMGYFNLDFLEEEEPEGKRGETTYDLDGKLTPQPQPPEKTFVEYERWGRYPAKEKDGKYVPAIDEQGKFEEDYELVECIIHYIQQREKDAPRHVIGFRKSKHTRRPMVKFLCYVDMVDDNGFGDGKVNRELQIAVDDNYNLMNMRSQLAVTPSFKGKRFTGLPEKVITGPGHITILEDLSDLEQWVIDDNQQSGIYHNQLLASKMDAAMATGPQMMGQPSDRAETATVGSIMNQRANIRIGMKSMNLEFIGFSDFYRMILTLCNDFMLPATLEAIIGEEMAVAYNPKRKDKFRPVSQALENDESKQFNIKTLQGLYQMTTSVQNPNTPKVLNMIWSQMVETMGTPYTQMKKVLFEDDPQTLLLYQMATGAKGTPSAPTPQNPGMPPQNQLPGTQSQAEQQTRAASPQQVL